MNQYSLDIDSISWHRIITTYGTAKEFPQYFKILWDMDNSTQVKNALSEKSVSFGSFLSVDHIIPASPDDIFHKILSRNIYPRAYLFAK